MNWKPEIDGEDLVIRHARVTCFGGANDPQDNGDTASGVSTKDPAVVGCALPMRTPTLKELRDSPLPRMPWKTEVMFTEESTLKAQAIPVIDLGPALHTGNAGDLTIAAAKFFNPHASATNFEMIATIRVIGGAKYLRGDV